MDSDAGRPMFRGQPISPAETVPHTGLHAELDALGLEWVSPGLSPDAGVFPTVTEVQLGDGYAAAVFRDEQSWNVFVVHYEPYEAIGEYSLPVTASATDVVRAARDLIAAK